MTERRLVIFNCIAVVGMLAWAPPGRASEGIALEVVGDAKDIGRWKGPVAWPTVGIHAIVLPTGRVLHYSYAQAEAVLGLPPEGAGSEAATWDPKSGDFHEVNWKTDVFCSGHSYLMDGSVLVTGGWEHSDCEVAGIPETHIFDPWTETWVEMESMSAGRYYPTNLTLEDGSVLIASGYDEQCKPVRKIERYVPGEGVSVVRGAARTTKLYPRLHLLDSGKIAHVAPESDTNVLDRRKGWKFIGSTVLGEPRFSGVSFEVPGEPNRLMICGGYRERDGWPTETCETIDFSEKKPEWSPAASMRFPRAHLNAVILPDKRVLVVGGGHTGDYETPILNPEIYDPEEDRWTLLPAQKKGRMYHSTAVLLPDGGVLSAGQDEHRGGIHTEHEQNGDWGEIYRPPYLYKGKRPRIARAPESADYRDSFKVKIRKPERVKSLVLIALSAVTHSINSTQRLVELDFEIAGRKTLEVTAPRKSKFAPPGYYMLFAVNQRGAVSKAKMLRIGGPLEGGSRF